MGYPADLYARVHQGQPGDVAFYRSACAEAHHILELGCGYGRILEGLAPLNVPLVGLELDKDLADQARSTLADAATVVVGDMRDFSMPHRFDRILLPYCGLYCLLSEAEVHACLTCVRDHLLPHGRLIMDAYVADDFHDDAPEGPEEDQVERLAAVVTDGDRRWDVYDRSIWDKATQRMDTTYRHVPSDGGPAVYGDIPQRYLLGSQVKATLTRAGFLSVSLFGGFDFEPFDPEGEIWVAVAEV